MATLSVAAVVVSHGQAELLAQCLRALESQTHPIQQVVVVETAGDEACLELARSFGFSTISPGDLRLGAAIDAGINALSKTPGWIWALHDDAVADSKALEELAKAAEISPSVAIIGPKLLDLDNPIQIQQMGLTATKTGRPFLLVRREYDQGQHDKAGDTLAVSTAGMLVSLGVWQQLGGLDDSSPTLAQDLEFGLKARAAGYRVVVEAGAKVMHAGLSMDAKRSRGWLGGSLQTALAKAHVHGATLLMPLPFLIAVYLLMPIYVLAAIPVNLVTKRPGRTIGQLAGWFWAWGSIGSRFAARARFRALGSSQGLRTLLATRKQISKRRRASYEAEPERAQSDLLPGMFRSNSVWFALLPVVAAARLFPQGAIVEGNYIPLGDTLASVWSSIGTQPLAILDGIAAPADPFNWILALAALLSPGNPSTAFATMAFLAPTFAFFGAWQLGKLFIPSAWAITVSALLYSLSPQVLGLIAQTGLVEILAIAIWPWTLYFVFRAYRAYNSARAWRWTGLAGLSLAALSVSSLMLFLLVAITAIAVGLFTIRRLPIVVWSLLPGIVLLFPWASHLISVGRYELLTSTNSLGLAPQSQLIDFVAVGVIGLVALTAWFGSELKSVSGLWLLALVAITMSWYQPVYGSAAVLTAGLLPLIVLVGQVLAAIHSSAWRRVLGGVFSLLPIASMVAFGPLTQADVRWQSDRLVPALIWAAAQQDESIRTLAINTSESITAEYVWGSGKTLEQLSLAAEYQSSSPQFTALVADASANLIAGNEEELQAVLSQLRVDFVLLENQDPEVEVAISKLKMMQPAGQTEFGSLWKVDVINSQALRGREADPIRNLQLGALVIFALLAIPTRASIRGYRRVTKRGSR